MMLRHKILLVVVILATVYLLGRCQRAPQGGATSTSGPSKSVAPVLPVNDKERIVFNETHHEVTIQTQKSVVKEYAKNPVVTISKTGSVVVTRHLAGFEIEPFLGGGYADTGRLFVGANCFHLSRFDLIGAVGWTADNRYSSLQPFVGLGYNFWNNTSINGVINPLSVTGTKGLEIGVMISVRL